MGTVIRFPAERRMRAVPPPLVAGVDFGVGPDTTVAATVNGRTGDVRPIPQAPEPWHMKRVEVVGAICRGLRGRVIGFDGQLLVALDVQPGQLNRFLPDELKLLPRAASPELPS